MILKYALNQTTFEAIMADKPNYRVCMKDGLSVIIHKMLNLLNNKYYVRAIKHLTTQYLNGLSINSYYIDYF